MEDFDLRKFLAEQRIEDEEDYEDPIEDTNGKTLKKGQNVKVVDPYQEWPQFRGKTGKILWLILGQDYKCHF